MEISTTTNILNAGFRRTTTASDLLNTDTFGIGNSSRAPSLNSSQSSALNAGFQQDNLAEQPVNAFGIGQANQPEVELSPQARILQQNEANQQSLSERLAQAREESQSDNDDQETESETDNSGFVRVASSEGSAQKNNIPAERAAEVYRSIQSLL
ncbi:hypothetical protein [Planctobacterium marinum]|uniref:Uncharacterized protein n=1 Tax=Planctobacterium marinum TaxID=1631968 RepID=A0AA48KS43_9ALTE|nr:hypothetical protein MACH26_37590 [Planctobacterium marinum]